MPGKNGHRPRPVRLPSPLTQAVLVAIGVAALVLFVLQLAAPRMHDFGADTSAPASAVATSRK